MWITRQVLDISPSKFFTQQLTNKNLQFMKQMGQKCANTSALEWNTVAVFNSNETKTFSFVYEKCKTGAVWVRMQCRDRADSPTLPSSFSETRTKKTSRGTGYL